MDRMFWTTTELLQHGATKRRIAESVRDGALIPVRKGHFAVPGAPEPVVRAVRVGGVATATTGAQALGLWTPADDVVHVAVAPTAARLRDPDDASLPLARHPEVAVHWAPALARPAAPSSRAASPGSMASAFTRPGGAPRGRASSGAAPSLALPGAASAPAPSGASLARSAPAWSATLETRVAPVLLVLEHAVRLLAPELAVAVIDSAVHLRFLRIEDLAVLRNRLPEYRASVLDLVDGRAESGIESVARCLLLLAGLRVDAQVRIGGVGRVDLLVEGRLIVELDGREWHSDFTRDRGRDAAAAIARYRTLRFTYAQVLHDWPTVLAAVRAALA